VRLKSSVLARLGPWILPGVALCAVFLAPGARTLAAGRLAQVRQATSTPPSPSQGGTQASPAPQRPAQDSPQQARPPRSGGPRLDWAWWKDEQIKTELGLTPWQVRHIDQLYQQRAQELTPIAAEWMKQSEVVDQLIRERTVTAEQLDIEILRLEALRSKLWESRQLMLYRMYLVLNPDQYKKLRTVADQRARGRRGGGEVPR
jgi:phage gp46-like protein